MIVFGNLLLDPLLVEDNRVLSILHKSALVDQTQFLALVLNNQQVILLKLFKPSQLAALAIQQALRS